VKIPTVKLTPTLLKAISQLETAIGLIAKSNIPIENIRRIEDKSILKSSLYSARIEGNALDEQTFATTNDQTAKIEVFNLVDVTNYLKHSPLRKQITLDDIRHIHTMVMNKLTDDAGHLRNNQNAIFDQSGSVRYLPPPPIAMRKDLTMLIDYCNSPSEFPILTSLIAHLVFEKIHPFIDGNGRVGRLLITMIMMTQGVQFPIVVPFERYLEDNRAQYYRHIDTGLVNPSEYLLFMLEGMTYEFEIVRQELVQVDLGHTPFLPIRQEEIYRIIIDHPYITVDGIRRRFMSVPVRTLRYDISKLISKKLVSKIGSTKGSCYKANTSRGE